MTRVPVVGISSYVEGFGLSYDNCRLIPLSRKPLCLLLYEVTSVWMCLHE